MQLYGLAHEADQAVHDIGTVEPELKEVFRDLTQASYILARDLVKFGPFEFQEIIISGTARLLHRHPLSSPSFGTREDGLYALSLLALMSSMLFSPGRQNPLPYNLLAESFRDALSGVLMTPAQPNAPILLWILMVGGISVFRDNDVSWLLSWIKTTASAQGIKDWPGARDRLCKYPWIPGFHDELGQKLWEQVATSDISL